MKRAVLCVVTFLLLAMPFVAEARVGGGGNDVVPRVIYTRPQSQSVVDLSGKNSLVFEWAMLPIPSGGRDSYRIVVHKGSGYNLIFSKTVDERIFSVEVPADKFEDGMEYWWYVKQRDAKTMMWSQYDIWYFKVIKK